MLLQLFLVFTYLSIIVSAINRDTIFLSILVSSFATFLGLTGIIKTNKSIKLPKHFLLMTVFVVILNVYVILVSDKLQPFYYATIIGEGLVYWLIFFNLKDGGRILKSLLIRLSLLYSLIYVFSSVFNISLIKLGGLIFTQEVPVRHYYFGGLWATTIVVIIASKWRNLKLHDLLLLVVGGVFWLLSNGRSAYLALFTAIAYLFFKQSKTLDHKNWIWISLTCLTSLVFIFSSFDRTTIFDRPYYLQSIQSFPKHLLGVGMGNFKQIAVEYQQEGVSPNSLSFYTHNIFLETTSGVGIFSVIFLIFIYKLLIDVLTSNGQKVIWASAILVLLTTFMLDTSYTVPGFLWIFFIILGVFESNDALF